MTTKPITVHIKSSNQKKQSVAFLESPVSTNPLATEQQKIMKLIQESQKVIQNKGSAMLGKGSELEMKSVDIKK